EEDLAVEGGIDLERRGAGGPRRRAGAQVAPARGALEEPARVLGLELVHLAARAGDDDAGGGQARRSSRPNAIAARIDRSAAGERERADHAEARAMRTDRRSRRAEIRKPGDEPADRRAALHSRERSEERRVGKECR